MNIWWVLSKLTDLTRGVYLYTSFKKSLYSLSSWWYSLFSQSDKCLWLTRSVLAILNNEQIVLKIDQNHDENIQVPFFSYQEGLEADKQQ